MKLRYKIWLEDGGKVFGLGPMNILKRVDRLGSLKKAAEEINMSYSQAWKLMRDLEGRLGFPLLVREVGGSAGGRSVLTNEARDLMERYEAFSGEADKMLAALYKKYFDSGLPS